MTPHLEKIAREDDVFGRSAASPSLTSPSLANEPATPSDGAGYAPELGQVCWGQPWKAYAVPEILDAALEFLRADLQRVLWNLRQESSDPFGNSAGSFRCPTFTVCAYSWNDDLAQPYNFKHPASGLLVSWYKYAGRGMSANMAVTPDLASRVLEHCIKGLRAVESGAHQYDEPGLYPDGSLADPEDGSQTSLASDGEVQRSETTEPKTIQSILTEGEGA